MIGNAPEPNNEEFNKNIIGDIDIGGQNFINQDE